MVSANQIPAFLYQLLLQHKLMKQRNLFHLDANLQKLKVDRNFF